MFLSGYYSVLKQQRADWREQFSSRALCSSQALFRSARRRRRPCGCRRQLLAPPWCSDDASGGPLRPLPRLSSRRPPPAGLAAQTGERCHGRAEGRGRRTQEEPAEPERPGPGRAPSRAGAAWQPLRLTRLSLGYRRSLLPGPRAPSRCHRPPPAPGNRTQGRRRLVASGPGTGTVRGSAQVRLGHRDALFQSELRSSRVGFEVPGDNARVHSAT